jgi:hypothetical protein
VVDLNSTEIGWRKSQASGLNGCVEIGRQGDCVFVRDSKHPGQAYLAFKNERWGDFVYRVKQGGYIGPRRAPTCPQDAGRREP